MTDRLDDETLAELQRLSDAATPGPWTPEPLNPGWVLGPSAEWETIVCRSGMPFSNSTEQQANGDLIAAARNALPSLLAEVRALRGERDQARAANRADLCRFAADALEGVLHEIDDIDDAELVARRADQWRAEADAAALADAGQPKREDCPHRFYLGSDCTCAPNAGQPPHRCIAGSEHTEQDHPTAGQP